MAEGKGWQMQAGLRSVSALVVMPHYELNTNPGSGERIEVASGTTPSSSCAVARAAIPRTHNT